MQTFTGKDYLKLDIANCFGLDKFDFTTRLLWVEEHYHELEEKMAEADDPIMYISAVHALRDTLKGIPTGHLVGFDACSSGLQIMACLAGCETTARNTGLVDPDNRADIYSTTTKVMNRLLKELQIEVSPKRSDVKQAQMTHFYGSRAKPKEIFGEDTIELSAFYAAQEEVAPGATQVMEEMLNAWNRDARSHSWTMPDGFYAHVKTMYPIHLRVEVDELDHATFTHKFYENLSTNEYEALKGDPERDGISLAANITHSIDGMVVREMNRRCNYNPKQVKEALDTLSAYLDPIRDMTFTHSNTFVSVVHAEDIDLAMDTLSTAELFQLEYLLMDVLSYRAFPIVCVHDDFKCHPNHMNRLRYWYKEILAEIAEADLLGAILSQITGETISYQKSSIGLPALIRNSNYALS